jgi:hypothetical protein
LVFCLPINHQNYFEKNFYLTLLFKPKHKSSSNGVVKFVNATIRLVIYMLLFVTIRPSAAVADEEAHLSFLRMRVLPSPVDCGNLRERTAAAAHLSLQQRIPALSLLLSHPSHGRSRFASEYAGCCGWS